MQNCFSFDWFSVVPFSGEMKKTDLTVVDLSFDYMYVISRIYLILFELLCLGNAMFLSKYWIAYVLWIDLWVTNDFVDIDTTCFH